MCDKAVDGNSNALDLVPDQCKIQELRSKAVDDNPKALDLVRYRYKTQVCDKAADDYSIAIIFVRD